VDFVVDKAALGQVFSEYFGFPCQSFHHFSIIIITRDWHNRPLSGRSVEWTQLDSTPHYTNLKFNRPFKTSELSRNYSQQCFLGEQ
jgi:hypothetical protein